MIVSRRKLLVTGGGLLAASCGPQTNQTLPALISAGRVSDLATGTLRAIAGMGVAVGRDARGIYALSVICTHAGCAVAPRGAQLVCPCHASIFKAADGSNVSGPALKPLPTFSVRVADGAIFAA